MGQTAQLTFSNVTEVDIAADVYIASFQVAKENNPDAGTEEFSVEARVAERIQLQSGNDPSYAIISVAMSDFPNDESAFATAFANGSFGQRMRLNTRCTISHRYNLSTATPILVGTVIDIVHDAKDDSVVVTVMDDRWLLSRFFVFGQIQYDPQKVAAGGVGMAFVAGEKCVFNQYGYPSCLDTPRGPRFAPSPRYGWKATDTKEPGPGSAILRARSWRVQDAVQYLREAHYDMNKWPVTGPVQAEYGDRWLPRQHISWPLGLGLNLEVTTNGENRANRFLHDFNIDGMDLNEALNLIAKRAGPFELYCIPGGKSGGDNGNDPGAALAGSGLGVYETLQAAFDSTVSAMNTAFDNSQAAFASYVRSSQQNLSSSIASFYAGLSSPAHPGVNKFRVSDTEEYKKLIVDINNSNALTYQAEVKQSYQYYLSKLGTMLDGNAGRYAVSDGTMASNNRAASQTQETLKSAVTGATGMTSTLVFISKSKRKGGQGVYIGGISQTDLTGAMLGNSVTRGVYRESIRNYFHKVALLGDPPVIERMVYTAISSGDPAETGLEPAWADADEVLFIAYWTGNGSNKKAFLEATQLWPLVFCAYRVHQDFDYLEGTKWAHMGKYRGRRNPRLFPFLITGHQQNESNPANWIPRQIPVEKSSGGGYSICSLYDNLTVSLDGSYFTLEALRDSDDHPTWNGSFTDPSSATANDIRVTLAIQADFRLSMLAGGTNEQGDPNETYRRVYHDQGAHQITTYVATSKSLDYVEWLRKNSYPVGQAIPAGYRPFPDKCTNGDELFTDRPTTPQGALDPSGRMYQHAMARLQEIKRISGGGELVYERFDPAFIPGSAVSGITDAGIPVFGVTDTVTIEANSNEVKRTLA